MMGRWLVVYSDVDSASVMAIGLWGDQSVGMMVQEGLGAAAVVGCSSTGWVKQQRLAAAVVAGIYSGGVVLQK